MSARLTMDLGLAGVAPARLPWSAGMKYDDRVRETYDGTTPTRMAGGAIAVLMLTILWHPDLDRIGDAEALVSLAAGREVLLSREAPRFAPPGSPRSRPLEDACVSRTPLRLEGLPGGGARLLFGESRTSVIYRGVALKEALDLTAEDLDRGAVLRLGGRIVLLLHRARVSDLPGGDAYGLVGESPRMHRVRSEIRRVAAMEVPVLIRGETGTGKELVARAIHGASARRDKPFVAVNLAAVPPGLAGSELFGAERGAFTGSVRPQPGYFRMAQGGTLFLDEVGEAPVEVQAMLLRALESGEVQTVGSQKVQSADVRILAATDADLEAKIKDGGFRAPLLHRLSTYENRDPAAARASRRHRPPPLHLPSGGARQGRRLPPPRVLASRRGGRLPAEPPVPAGSEWLPASIVARLAALDWPGNVRQLRNLVRQLVIANFEAERVEIGPAVERLIDDPAPRPAPSHPEHAAPPAARSSDNRITIEPPDAVPRAEARSRAPRARKPADIPQAELAEALRKSRWDIAAAADVLGISRASMYVLMERAPRIRTAGDVPADEIVRCHEACGGDLDRMVDRLEVSEKALRRRVRELGLATG